jgi:hypothetical protein
MAKRLQRKMNTLIDKNQTTFIQNRSTIETSLVARGLINFRSKNKISSVALKIDFRKAFDIISWDFYTMSYKNGISKSMKQAAARWRMLRNINSRDVSGIVPDRIRACLNAKCWFWVVTCKSVDLCSMCIVYFVHYICFFSVGNGEMCIKNNYQRCYNVILTFLKLIYL